jgi:ZIP family zinc transporter
VAFVVRTKPTNGSHPSPLSHRTMSFSLALAGSVMVTVSFVSLLPESFANDDNNERALLSIQSTLFWERVISFLSGCGLYWLLSKCFPEPVAILNFDDVEQFDANRSLLSSNHKEIEFDLNDVKKQLSKQFSGEPLRIRQFGKETYLKSAALTSQIAQDKDDEKAESSLGFFKRYTAGEDLPTAEAQRAWRVAMLLFVSLLVHNFPEGFAVAASTMHSPKLGLTTALAIALHNIPEGIAIAVPCLAARPDSPWLAFGLASGSGLAEPLGAAVALFFLKQLDPKAKVSSGFCMKNVLSFVAGTMTMVAINELFPEAWRYSKDGKHSLVIGTAIGAVVMIASDAYLDG